MDPDLLKSLRFRLQIYYLLSYFNAANKNFLLVYSQNINLFHN